ncbi:PREDICTED: subtilisin-like protease SBT4.3 [Lupinus angustifolius]|uniref:subtilisin-like protease SBT4.3 n=1 Tax=Lupinus angustifolius TaxID=3871 RepID=UPI00092E7B8A|nr:PREDICTED: subtilisin-like protease SBT4.3 [Lupinus angustifolius]
MGSIPKTPYSPTSHHLSMLQQIFHENNATNFLIHSNKRSFNGFVAMLTNQQKDKISQMEESDVIVGVLDTGVWPKSDSFKDEGFRPIPKNWKGACVGGNNFTCNNKIIGARYYIEDSARDADGHGSHTTSTVAGNYVHKARCDSSASLSAFDDAIANGVSIISISLGLYSQLNFEEDPIAIGSFHAMAGGILTVNSVGNGGPLPTSISSVSMWMLSVVANSSVVDRKIVLCDGISYVDYDGGHPIGSIIRDSNEAEILKSKTIKDLNAPMVADFSTRGPNTIVPEIMKPGISASGVDILASFSQVVSPSNNECDKRSLKYNIISGTSISCPHVVGIAAYMKTFHLGWSPSAIKSAIMTSAKPMKVSNDEVGEYAYGSGHVNHVHVVHPGLIYDISLDDYIQMLCNLGYDNKKIKLISGKNNSSSNATDRSLVRDLNYPAFAIDVKSRIPFTIKFERTVTNVGQPKSNYKASILPNPKIKITVVSETLAFESLYEK